MLKTWLRSWVRLSILRKGFGGQSRFWLAVGVGAVLRRLVRRFGGKEPVPVFGERLKPGDRWLVTYERPPGRRDRRSREAAPKARQTRP